MNAKQRVVAGLAGLTCAVIVTMGAAGTDDP